MSGSPPLKVNPPRHDLQAVSILAKFFGCLPERYWDAVAHIPRVRVVTIQASKLATACPCNEANTRAIDGRAGSERMEEAHLPGGQCSPNVGFRDATAQVHAQFERASCLQRNILQLLFLTHRRLVSVKSAVDHIHLLLASQPHEVHGIS